ncbi:hypothetical protein Q3304_14825 [Clostridioides sp. GD02377]|uniref:hypothetical protein n=1 Tax=Clostridioides sp. GD02377 TaxID=3054353 RepID=UPI0038A2508B
MFCALIQFLDHIVNIIHEQLLIAAIAREAFTYHLVNMIPENFSVAAVESIPLYIPLS